MVVVCMVVLLGSCSEEPTPAPGGVAWGMSPHAHPHPSGGVPWLLPDHRLAVARDEVAVVGLDLVRRPAAARDLVRQVRAVTAHELVHAEPAEQLVDAARARDRVVAGAAVEDVL